LTLTDRQTEGSAKYAQKWESPQWNDDDEEEEREERRKEERLPKQRLFI
jgi:hypothetical protein